MTKYNVLLAANVPAYRNIEIEAESDVEALEKIKSILQFKGEDATTLSPEYGEMFDHRLVDLSDNDGRFVAGDLMLEDSDTIFVDTLDKEIELMKENNSNSEE